MRLNSIRYAALCVALVASVSMLGCKDKNPSAPKVTAAPTTAAEIDPRSKVIGVEPNAFMLKDAIAVWRVCGNTDDCTAVGNKLI